MIQVVKLPGDAVRELLTPVLGGTEEQRGVTVLNGLEAEAHHVVVVPLWTPAQYDEHPPTPPRAVTRCSAEAVLTLTGRAGVNVLTRFMAPSYILDPILTHSIKGTGR